MTTSEKQAELDKIALEIKAFKGLDIAKNCTKAVPGKSDPGAVCGLVHGHPGPATFGVYDTSLNIFTHILL